MNDGFININDSLGTATMDEDGVLKLILHRNVDTRFNFGAVLKIAPDNPRYDKYIAHLGGIIAGEHKQIPPWPPA